MLNRREFLAGLGGVVMAAGIAEISSACNWFLKPSPQREEGARTIIPEEVSWRALPAIERIHKLEKLEYLHILNPRDELTLATAQFYCEQTRCKKDPEQMAQDVFFLTPEQFVEKEQELRGRALSEQEIKLLLQARPEFTDIRGRIFLNLALIEKLVNDLRAEQRLIQSLAGRDVGTVVKKSILFHAYSHLNQTRQSFAFDPLLLSVQGGGTISLDGFEGLAVRGRDADGSPTFFKSAAEAVIELSSMKIGQRSGSYLGLSKPYQDGALLMEMLNKRSNVGDQEFLEYANGTRPFKDLLRKWGSIKNRVSPDEKVAILAYITIGVRIQDGYTQAETLQRIEGLLESELRQ